MKTNFRCVDELYVGSIKVEYGPTVWLDGAIRYQAATSVTVWNPTAIRHTPKYKWRIKGKLVRRNFPDGLANMSGFAASAKLKWNGVPKTRQPAPLSHSIWPNQSCEPGM